MEITIPKGFIETDAATFEFLTDQVDWVRDGFSNGEYYNVREKRVGVHMTDGRCFYNPEFFKLHPNASAR